MGDLSNERRKGYQKGYSAGKKAGAKGELVDCARCNGTGKIENWGVIKACSVCKGKGKVRV
jgi:DnaJ-class molecular chaperone